MLFAPVYSLCAKKRFQPAVYLYLNVLRSYLFFLVPATLTIRVSIVKILIFIVSDFICPLCAVQLFCRSDDGFSLIQFNSID